MGIELKDGTFEKELSKVADGEWEGRGGAGRSKSVRPPGMGRGLILFASGKFPVEWGWSTKANEGF